MFTLYKRMHNIKILFIKEKKKCNTALENLASQLQPSSPSLLFWLFFLLPLYITI